MNHPPHRIPEEEYNSRVKAIIEKLIPKGTADRPETDELFELYNDRELPTEDGKHCSSCRARVFKRMQKTYERIKQQESNG
jgi:hypothetical protein